MGPALDGKGEIVPARGSEGRGLCHLLASGVHDEDLPFVRRLAKLEVDLQGAGGSWVGEGIAVVAADLWWRWGGGNGWGRADGRRESGCHSRRGEAEGEFFDKAELVPSIKVPRTIGG